MVNQERVGEMTKLAIFDQNEGQECRPMIQYFRKDYIVKEMKKSFFTATIAFGLLAVIAVLYFVENLMEQISSSDIRQFAVNVISCYAAFLAAYFLITYIVYYMRYTKGRQKVKKYYQHLKKVNRLYHDEEQM